jgi:hypothetical protein
MGWIENERAVALVGTGSIGGFASTCAQYIRAKLLSIYRKNMIVLLCCLYFNFLKKSYQRGN